jgi:hypothetical protein
VVDGNAIQIEIRESGICIAPDIAALSVVGTLSSSIRVTQGMPSLRGGTPGMTVPTIVPVAPQNRASGANTSQIA